MNKQALITNILLCIICICLIIVYIDNYKQSEDIITLNAKLDSVSQLSSERQTYLNRRIDLVDLQSAEASHLAESTWDQADGHRKEKYRWMEGRTTEEIDSIWKDHVANKTPLPE